MERFQEAMFLIAHTMGIQHLGYTIINDGTKRDLWSSFRGNLTAEDVRRMETYSSGWVPAEDEQLVGAVNTHAPVDERMYAQAVQQFDAQLASLEPDVRACMQEYVAMQDVDGWHGTACVADWGCLALHPISSARVCLCVGQAASKAFMVPLRAAHQQRGPGDALHAAAKGLCWRRVLSRAQQLLNRAASCRAVTLCGKTTMRLKIHHSRIKSQIGCPSRPAPPRRAELTRTAPSAAAPQAPR